MFVKNLFLLFLALSLIYSSPLQGQTTEHDVIDVTAFSIMNVKTGKSISMLSTEAEIIAAFGAPDSSRIFTDEENGLVYKELKYNGLEFILYENRIDDFMIKNANYGLKLKGKVIQVNHDLKSLRPLFPSSFKLKSSDIMLVWLKNGNMVVDVNIGFFYDQSGRISAIIGGGYD